jgi:hypothetical protein
MGTPFRWLMKAVDVGRRNPRALFGGFAILMLISLVPTVVQMVLQSALADSPGLMWSLYALVVLASMVAMPPITGAAIRLLHACETGQPAAALDVFNGYRDGAFALRMVLTALLLLLFSVVVMGVLYTLLPAKEFIIEAFSRSMATPPGGQPDMTGLDFDPASLPWLFLWMVGAMAAIFTAMHVQLLATTHAALSGQGPVDSLLSGLQGTLKNVLPLTGFTVSMLVIGFVAMLVLALVLGLLAVVLTLASPVLAGVVLVPAYLLAVLIVLVVLYGFYYHAWREIFGETAADPLDAIAA